MSFRWRLILWQLLLIGTILLTLDFLVYFVLSQNLLNKVDQTLEERAQWMRAMLEAQKPTRLDELTLPSAPPLSSPGVYFQVLDPQGQAILACSASLGHRRLPFRQEMVEAAARGERPFETLMVDGKRWRFHYTPLQLEGHMVGVMEVASSLQEVDAVLRLTLALLITSSLITLILAALMGWQGARWVLQPIDQITQAALTIARAQDLSKRIKGLEGRQDELGRLAATFNEMLERLETLFQTQQRLVADVSHELRTPLTTIRGNVEILRRGAIKNPLARDEALAAIDAETARMSRLVSDLLLLAQADAGAWLEMQPVELDTLLLEVYRQAQMMANGVEVKLGHEDQAIVLGDADRLKQLLLNLVDNALKYTPPGGEVTLSLHREGEWVRVSVSDTGIGIPKEDLPHIFDRFYRADRSRSRKRGGAGLGLSIAKWIAEAHGGYLTVESEVGKGSTFSLWLKRAKLA